MQRKSVRVRDFSNNGVVELFGVGCSGSVM